MGSPTISKILAIAPKFTALLSFFGSLGIIIKVLHDDRLRSKPVHRIVAGLSMTDLMVSIWYFAGSWVIPVGTVSWFGNDQNNTETVFWAAGSKNNVGCELGGFFNQYGVASPLYNGTLAWYFLLVIYYQWSDTRIKKIEWMFHAIPCGYATVTSIFGIATDLYGHVEWTCWILPSEEDRENGNFAQKNFKWFQWIFLFGIVWVCVIWLTVVFVLLHKKMKELENKMNRYSSPSFIRGSVARLSTEEANSSDEIENASERGLPRESHVRSFIKRMSTRRSVSGASASSFSKASQSRKIAVQGMLYVAAFYVTWLFPTLNRICDLFELTGNIYHTIIHTTDAILLPLQGFFNFWIFITPRLTIYRKKRPEVSFLSALREVVFGIND